MTDDQIVNIWMTFKEYLDKKHVEMAAEKYVDLLADYGVDDIVLKEALGHEDSLDTAISYYLDIDYSDEED